MNSAIQVSVIIPTVNRGEFLADTIEQIFSNSYPLLELIVVDQTELYSEATARRLQELQNLYNYQHLRLPVANAQLARNVGWRRSTGEVIIFCDDDVVLERNVIERHVQCYVDPSIGAVGGRIVPQQAMTDCDLTRTDVGRLHEFGPLQGHFYSTARGEIEWGMGCNMSFRREALEAVDGFDERYTLFTRHDDVSAFVRVRQQGYRAVFEPEAAVTHLKVSTGGSRTVPDVRMRMSSYLRSDALIGATIKQGTAPHVLLKRGVQAALHVAATSRGGVIVRRNRQRSMKALICYLILMPAFLTFFAAYLKGLVSYYWGHADRHSRMLTAGRIRIEPFFHPRQRPCRTKVGTLA